MEANANIPHDLSAKGVLTYTGDYFSCLSIHEHVNGLDIQGKYSQVTVDVPGHINNYKYNEIDNVTWQEMRANFNRRQPIKLPHGIGCKAFPPPDPGYWKASLNTTTITLGVCIPEPCSTVQAIDFVLDTKHRPLTLEGKVIQPNYSIQFYRLPSDKPISSSDCIFITILVCVILLTITGTVCDIKNTDNLPIVSTKLMLMFRCFAVHKNIQQFLKVTSSSNTVQCVDGIRAIAMAMIIWRHCYSAGIWIWFMWILAIFILTLSVAGMTIIWDSINNQVLHNIINSNMMAVWSVAVSWIIIACHFGYGGPVNMFLSVRQLKLLSRLSYGMYIFHGSVIYWMISVQSDDTVVLKTFQLTTFQLFLTTYFASVIIAFIIAVLIEQPVLNLYKVLLGGKKLGANIKTAVEHEENFSSVAVSTLNILDQEGK